MPKLDFLRSAPALYRASAREPTEIDIPCFRFLRVDGQGDPNTTPAYAEAVRALFSVSYAAKFRCRRAEGGVDYRVMPLEGLWWADQPSAFVANDRTQWNWTMQIRQPDFLSPAFLAEVQEEVFRKSGLPAAAALRVEDVAEGRCAQILHVGPFDAEGPTIARLHAFIAARGGRLTGKHHEIYLSDVRRAAPARWRTILRQPLA
jgi:hypothetical protein